MKVKHFYPRAVTKEAGHEPIFSYQVSKPGLLGTHLEKILASSYYPTACGFGAVFGGLVYMYLALAKYDKEPMLELLEKCNEGNQLKDN